MDVFALRTFSSPRHDIPGLAAVPIGVIPHCTTARSHASNFPENGCSQTYVLPLVHRKTIYRCSGSLEVLQALDLVDGESKH